MYLDLEDCDVNRCRKHQRPSCNQAEDVLLVISEFVGDDGS
jgi:hypothetical protein